MSRFIVEFMLLLSVSSYGVVFYPFVEFFVRDKLDVTWSYAPVVITVILNIIAYVIVLYFSNKRPVFEFNLKR